MRHFWRLCLFDLLVCSLWAQHITQVTASPTEVAFIKHMLVSIASPDHDPTICALNESNLVRLYGFNSQEAALFHSAGLAYAEAVHNFRDQIASGSQSIIPSASAQVDSVISALASHLLTSVRAPEAEMIKIYASKVAAATNNGGN